MPKGGFRPQCSVPGCVRANHARGLCSLHYRNQPDQKAAALRRGQKPARKLAAKRHRQTAAARLLLSASSRRFRYSAKGRAFYLKLRQRYATDKSYREHIKRLSKEQRARWPIERRARAYSLHKQWLKTEQGKQHLRRRSLKLLNNAPLAFVETCELLRQLRKEMKHEHKRA